MTSEAEIKESDDRAGGVQVIARAATILYALGDKPDGMSLGEISQQVGLAKSTTKRIISALEAANFVRTVGPGEITLGAGLIRLASLAQIDVVEAARPWLRKLNEAVNETVVLSTANKLHIVILHRIIANRQLVVMPKLGPGELQLHCTSAGRTLLARHSDAEVAALLSSKAIPEGGAAPDLPILLKQLENIRSRGFAIDQDELMEGITTLAAGVDTVFGRLAVSIPMPSTRFQRDEAQYLRHLNECCAGLAGAIGLR